MEAIKKPRRLAGASDLCDPAGTRTLGPNIKSVVLYQLSYEIISFLGVQKYRLSHFVPNVFQLIINRSRELRI